ncbi:nascent polypeptide-associated complex subunit alpha, muscle-specific form-like isoform X2 [Cimex lectularius]|uniref:Uncharacterized protein n=1 Tax=Cimex lectularius TaxID=79782 RepID=A0A8I6TE26_CIMLE|nr:nascent polypeptide-associated complex subunit alpha, muscle-specific form-like isoform X2 [Cimex lectularius]
MSMIHRTASSKRRRPSRSAATSPHRTTTGSRRPSVAVCPATTTCPSELTAPVSRQRRASIAVPEDTSPSPTEFVTITAAEDEPDSEPDFDVFDRSPRGSLVPEHRSPRGSLTPEAFNRSPRNSLVPDFNRSPRNSIIPDTRGSRNNLLPEPVNYNRSPRGSLCPDGELFSRSRSSLLAEDFNRSPRNSLVPEYNRSARNSLVPDVSPSRSARNSLVPDTSPSRTPRGSISIAAPEPSRTPRGSITPDPARSPRGSLIPDVNRSPRGSLVPDSNRSPRGSIASETSYNRSPRNSLPLQESPSVRSPRGSIGSASLHDQARSPRGSVDITLPGVRGGCNRSPSPYRNQRSQNYTTQDSTGSRRASSSVSQVSGDERRHLCEHTKLNSESGGVAAYGSVVYQLNHANMEASGTCDFMLRAFGIVYRTVVVSVVLICLTALPLIMFIMGIQFVRDCPREQHIPVYMIVGGTFGTLKMVWLVWRQIRSLRFERRRERNSTPQDPLSTPSRVADILLSSFLVVWFVLGNVWILSIYWPEFEPTLFEPNRWCHKTLYIFSLIHLAILYSIIGVVIILFIVLLMCQLCICNMMISCK